MLWICALLGSDAGSRLNLEPATHWPADISSKKVSARAKEEHVGRACMSTVCSSETLGFGFTETLSLPTNCLH